MTTLLAPLAVVCVVAGACGSPEEDPAAARPTATSRPTGERPLSDVDPCRLLTPARQRELGVDQPPQPDHDPTVDAPSCVFSAQATGLRFDVTAVGAVTPTDLAAQRRPDQLTREIAIGGAPAREVRPPTDGVPADAHSCEVDVPVAEGQFLRVTVGQRGTRTPQPQDALCAKTVLAAEAVLTTLRERR
ncbi:DUF3558 domain-containing protein [Streptoalloteichus tenebrarius]|uniref:DUF3558 domain-containing protein n=1 Tax=Streptoalloteichus tenebrarius (strain ATCC 17920 / DSM 40477 / JCM 4838 / CBS 697.72 / NBRC 16177 / NCIMB 11028 / NRRL B-12390 / A12253. 1 / ISP 5477) TaxID=1933 RepID=UPI0020A4A0AB|nr:DUF3558 domain-containing protein [Streptoalloteichus tenebrarius]BFF02251.1 hypothetical protein GCM10020241_39260 [Streptoalloteichus tenebrarius]